MTLVFEPASPLGAHDRSLRGVRRVVTDAPGKYIGDPAAELVPSDTEVLAGLQLGGVPAATALSLATDLPVVQRNAGCKSTRVSVDGLDGAGTVECMCIEIVIEEVPALTRDLAVLAARVVAVVAGAELVGGAVSTEVDSGDDDGRRIASAVESLLHVVDEGSLGAGVASELGSFLRLVADRLEGDGSPLSLGPDGSSCVAGALGVGEMVAEALTLSRERLDEATEWLRAVRVEADAEGAFVDVAYNCLWVAGVGAAVAGIPLEEFVVDGVPDWVRASGQRW